MSGDAEFYYDEFLKFAKNFHKTLQEENFIIDVMNRLGNLMVTTVKEKTPVGQYDTKVYFVRGGKLMVFEAEGSAARQGGHLRRNWVLDGVSKEGDGYVVTISNNVEYASFVENGHRSYGKKTKWVEGQFFLKLTMEEIMEQLPKVVGPEYEAYLRKFGFD